MKTEFSFTLPKGLLDEDGTLHREGTMRLATAADEIIPMRDPRVMANPSYLVIILLARTVTKLGTLAIINPKIIEGLFAADLAYLQTFYQNINGNGQPTVPVSCPNCQHKFDVDLSHLGE